MAHMVVLVYLLSGPIAAISSVVVAARNRHKAFGFAAYAITLGISQPLVWPNSIDPDHLILGVFFPAFSICIGLRGVMMMKKQLAVAKVEYRLQESHLNTTNECQRELVAYLTEIKDRRIGFMELQTDIDGIGADVSLDARYDLFAPECIFDDCTDAQAKLFLTGFVTGKLAVSWTISEQLSKLLSKRGLLIREIINPLLTQLNWGSIGTYLLFLSYLAIKEDGAVWANRLLEVVPDDGRDGLFLACYYLNSEELDRKLMGKFVEWDAEQRHDLSATGNIGALKEFIAKWLPMYPYKDLEQVIRLYFKHVRQD